MVRGSGPGKLLQPVAGMRNGTWDVEQEQNLGVYVYKVYSRWSSGLTCSGTNYQ